MNLFVCVYNIVCNQYKYVHACGLYVSVLLCECVFVCVCVCLFTTKDLYHHVTTERAPLISLAFHHAFAACARPRAYVSTQLRESPADLLRAASLSVAMCFFFGGANGAIVRTVQYIYIYIGL